MFEDNSSVNAVFVVISTFLKMFPRRDTGPYPRRRSLFFTLKLQIYFSLVYIYNVYCLVQGQSEQKASVTLIISMKSQLLMN